MTFDNTHKERERERGRYKYYKCTVVKDIFFNHPT